MAIVLWAVGGRGAGGRPDLASLCVGRPMPAAGTPVKTYPNLALAGVNCCGNPARCLVCLI